MPTPTTNYHLSLEVSQVEKKRRRLTTARTHHSKGWQPPSPDEPAVPGLVVATRSLETTSRMRTLVEMWDALTLQVAYVGVFLLIVFDLPRWWPLITAFLGPFIWQPTPRFEAQLVGACIGLSICLGGASWCRVPVRRACLRVTGVDPALPTLGWFSAGKMEALWSGNELSQHVGVALGHRDARQMAACHNTLCEAVTEALIKTMLGNSVWDSGDTAVLTLASSWRGEEGVLLEEAGKAMWVNVCCNMICVEECPSSWRVESAIVIVGDEHLEVWARKPKGTAVLIARGQKGRTGKRAAGADACLSDITTTCCAATTGELCDDVLVEREVAGMHLEGPHEVIGTKEMLGKIRQSMQSADTTGVESVLPRLDELTLARLRIAASRSVQSPEGPTLVWDCVEMSLLAWTDEPYLAISYVWSMYDDKAITEAGIRLAEDTGYRYIWCDRLCIDQTDQLAVQKEVERMGGIYSTAAAVTVMMENIEIDEPSLRYGLAGMVAVSRETASRTREVLRVADAHPWNKRAWTLMEGKRANQLLVVFKHQVFDLGWMQLIAEHEHRMINANSKCHPPSTPIKHIQEYPWSPNACRLMVAIRERSPVPPFKGERMGYLLPQIMGRKCETQGDKLYALMALTEGPKLPDGLDRKNTAEVLIGAINAGCIPWSILSNSACSTAPMECWLPDLDQVDNLPACTSRLPTLKLSDGALLVEGHRIVPVELSRGSGVVRVSCTCCNHVWRLAGDLPKVTATEDWVIVTATAKKEARRDRWHGQVFGCQATGAGETSVYHKLWSRTVDTNRKMNDSLISIGNN
ncbi:hypothetical protein PG997_014077 [Apiospora hydei]|uniref:Heterokaryon incompatibility domain-containing protein n=1 Tax=Apiospora hydei TaxID=1337664 RepID=A0ABR1V815_9PEZI